MSPTSICIIKRDGKRESFSAAKIYNAIGKAFTATGMEHQEQLIDLITRKVVNHLTTPTIGVEEIQDIVENELSFIEIADQRLYTSKHNGRDCVTVDSSSTSLKA